MSILIEITGLKTRHIEPRGLIDFLSSYSFTIDENVPDDQEVALVKKDSTYEPRLFEDLSNHKIGVQKGQPEKKQLTML